MVLASMGTVHRGNEEQRRALRLRVLFRDGMRLSAYRGADLNSRGWADAFASTIEQLEAAGLRPADIVAASRDESVQDLADVWTLLDADAGTSWSVHRTISEATDAIRADRHAWPCDGPVLALIPHVLDAVHAKFIRAIPKVTIGVAPRRPMRRRYRERVRLLLGDDVAAKLEEAELLLGARAPSVAANELAILGAYAFDLPERLNASARPRSCGPDGTVSLEAYAGVDEEVDAATRWVADEVRRGTPLQDLAILVPRPEPYAELVAERIAALPWPTASRPVYLAAGRPATSVPVGARVLSLLRAIAAYLPMHTVVALLPRLRLDGVEGHLSPGRAREVIRALGTIGGSASRPNDALLWRERLGRLDSDEHERIRPVAKALSSLVALMQQVIADSSMGELWQATRAFVYSELIMPGDPKAVIEPLHDDLVSLIDDPITAQIRGLEAVELIAERLEVLRLHEGRFGDPAVYVGPIDGAVGLSFAAVRVLGLAESVFPGTLRQDALLTAEARACFPFVVSSDDDYTTARVHALHQIIRDARERVVLSTPRSDIDGSEREPSSLFVEVAAAIGRPNAATGVHAARMPTMVDLERDGFGPARASISMQRAESPLLASCWHDAVAARASLAPSEWSTSLVVTPSEIAARATSMDGALGASALTMDVPGQPSMRPLSAHVLQDLLTCPQRFFLRHVLGLRPRADLFEPHHLPALQYGALLHAVAQQFFQTYGARFSARENALAEWVEIADSIAVERFDDVLGEYPLLGETTVAYELRRLRRDVRTLIEDDWVEQPRVYIDVERVFGDRERGVDLATASGAVHLTGRIDRLDCVGEVTLVRDLKSGRAKPREGRLAAPDIRTDLQLAIYVLVVERVATLWGVPPDVAAAYTYVDRFTPVRERAFVDDRKVLRAAGQNWLDVAAALLRENAFVRTPDSDDCRLCAFKSVCSDAPKPVPTTTAVSLFLELRS